MRKRLIVPFVSLLMVAAACGSSKSDEGSSSNTTAAGTTTSAAGGTTTSGASTASSVSFSIKDTGKVTLLSAGEPAEVAAYQTIFDDLINSKTKYKAEVVQTGQFEQQFQIQAAAGTLDLAAAPQPGAIPALVDKGLIVALEDLGFNIDELNKLVGESFMSLGLYKGKHYGLPTNINLKSMVWYPKKAFDAAGYTVPKTWTELMALSDKIVAAGSSPWCVGYGSEGSTGWPATDWMEDIMLRTAGPDVYDKWVKHEIPFNDPAVKHAGELFGQAMFTKGYVLGGVANTPDIKFSDSPAPMFENPPKCWLHRQATFINSFFPKTAQAGVDYDWFPFPAIDQQGTLYGGELTVVGKAGNRAEVVDFMRRFIAQDVQCAMGGVQASSRVSPNVTVGKGCYANTILAAASVILTDALKTGNGRFDASDLMPAAVGSGSFWTEMVNYMKNGPSYLDTALANVQKSWPS
jgi:alpha-glucoside transport system substrate-binding protein